MSDLLMDELVEAWRTHNRINLFLLERISDAGWTCSAGPRGGGRVWKQFAHVHTVRVAKLENWHKPLSAGLPKYAGEEVVPREELIAAFRRSGDAVEQFFRVAAAGETRKRGFKKGLMTSLAYLVSHESHHRGNILLTLKLCGHRVDRRMGTASGTGTGCRSRAFRPPAPAAGHVSCPPCRGAHDHPQTGKPMTITDASAVPAIKKIALGDLDAELDTTRRLLERVPDEHLDWKPHQKSMTLGGLALHVATLVFWITHTLRHDHFDIITDVTRNAPPTSRQQILDAFEAKVAEMRQALDAADDATLRQPWQLRAGGKVLMEMPKLGVIRGLGINHMVHHRGQLSVYLRLLNVPLPPMYGPTADEQPNFG